MKKLLFFFLASVAFAQTNVQKSIATSTLNQITGDLKVGSGKTVTVMSGGVLDVSSGTFTLAAGQIALSKLATDPLARANHTGTQAWSTLTATPTTLAGYGIADAQPLDSDLTAIAALSTTAYGRSVLPLADASAARTLFGAVIGTDVQAYDSDLAAIAALTTTSTGRSVLELSSLADLGLPSQTSNSGKYLTTNGTVSSWGTVDALPSQSGNNGKFLTTDGSAASWATVTQPSAANPTQAISGTVGTANNGVAATFMRSDASPALPATITGLNSITSATNTALSLTAAGTGGLSITTGTSGMLAQFSGFYLGADASGSPTANRLYPYFDDNAMLGAPTKRWVRGYFTNSGLKIGDGTNGPTITASGTSPNETLLASIPGTGAFSVKPSGTSYPILIGSDSTYPTYGAISFNGVITDGGMLGIAAGATSELYIKSPSGGNINLDVGGNATNEYVFSTTSVYNANSAVTIGKSGNPYGGLFLTKTVTAGGTTGAQTINKATGSVNFAAAATSLVVTNSLVSTSSVIICTVAANDTTMKSVAVVAASGSFTIYANAAATAETRVNFLVTN